MSSVSSVSSTVSSTVGAFARAEGVLPREAEERTVLCCAGEVLYCAGEALCCAEEDLCCSGEVLYCAGEVDPSVPVSPDSTQKEVRSDKAKRDCQSADGVWVQGLTFSSPFATSLTDGRNILRLQASCKHASKH